MCGKCMWGHNNKRDVEEPDHCTCECHNRGLRFD